MALWNKVLSGFNADDETVNFGARSVAENENGCIYETSTLATIQSDEVVSDDPNVYASVQCSMVCAAVDKSITIFSDESCGEIILSVGFESLITAYCISKNGHFVLIALTDGIMHCLHLPTGGQQVFEQNISEQFGADITEIFVQDWTNSFDIFIVTSKGVIYSIKEFESQAAHSALINQNMIELNKIVERLNCVKIIEDPGTSLVVSIPSNNPKIPLSLVTFGKKINLWSQDGYCYRSGCLSHKFKKAHYFEKYRVILGLRQDGYLSLICPETLLVFRTHMDCVADFAITEDETQDCYQIVILPLVKEEGPMRSSKIVSFPDFQWKFSIDLPSTTYLVDVIGCSTENFLFLEGVQNFRSKIDTIRIKGIVQTEPEYRLKRLLKRGRFEEAEQFAMQFKLSLDLVNAANAAACMNQLGSWAEMSKDPKAFERVISILDKINDIKHIYEFCNNALKMDYKQTRGFLLYACDRVIQSLQDPNNHNNEELLSTLNENLRKLETFDLIQKIKIYDRKSDAETTEEWSKFLDANLLSECMKHLSEGELEIAQVIWIRHVPEFASHIYRNRVSAMLSSIPETVDPHKLWSWLSHFIPSSISLLPDCLSEIIDWTYKKTLCFEKHYRQEWPQIGLDFSQRVLNLLSFQDSSIYFSLNQKQSSDDLNFHQLTTLIQAMTDLLELKTRYRVTLRLDTYLDDPTNVIHTLLNKVHVDEIPNLIETFLQQYMLNNSLINDQVFCSYIQKKLKDSKSWQFWEKAPWEERVAVVMEHIRDVQNRLQQTVDVLRKAPVPWSKTITTLCEKSYNFDHPLVSKIRTERNGVSIKLILKKYGYAHIGLCTQLFRQIIKQGRKEMIEDICELTKTDKKMRMFAFNQLINYHINAGNLNKAVEVLRNVEDEIAQYCCEQIVYCTIAHLNFKKRIDYLVNYIEMLGYVEMKSQTLSCSSNASVSSNYSLNQIPILKKIYKLEKEFDVWINHANYYTKREEIVENYIDKLIAAVASKQKSILESCEDLEKVSGLLSLSPLASILIYFDRTKELDILKRSITRMSIKRIETRDGSRDFYKLCTTWITNADRDFNVASHLLQLCASNFCNCDDDQLSDAVTCYNHVYAYREALGHEVNYKTEAEDNTLKFDGQNQDSLYVIYKDTAISPSNMLLPFFKDSLRIINFYTGTHPDEDSMNQQEIEFLVKGLIERAKILQNEHHDYSLLHITKYLHYGLASLRSADPAVITETRAVLSQCLYTLLRRVVGGRSLDICLGLACLFSFTEYDACKWLTTATRSFQGDFVRHREVVNLGYEYSRLVDLDVQLYTFDNQKLLHRWGRRLREYGILYKEMFSSDMVQKRDILERIMHTKKPNLIPLLKDFCENFGFNQDDCLMLYLRVLLTTWQPRYELVPLGGRKEISINESDVNDLNARCKEVAAAIEDKRLMKRNLAELRPQINFYHYEVFLAMLDLVDDRNIERIELFCFLKNYTRYGRPTEYEREAWANLSFDNSSLPPISQWRFPFLPDVDQFKLIAAELNLKSYSKWLSIAPTLKIQSHVICTLAIKGSVTEAWEKYINNEDRSQDWSLHPRNSGLLKEIKKCITHMGGTECLYYGTAALYFVTNHTPPGADQVAAAQECFASAQRWEERINEVDNNHEAMIAKVKDKYLRLTSKHILHTHGVGKEKYLSLIGYPEKLIRELYNDESIPERYRNAVHHRPDINSAVEALARLFSLNLIKIRYDYMLEWLRTDNWENRHNDSLTMGFNNSLRAVEDNSVEEDNLLRACYILESGDTKLHAKLLIDIGFGCEKDDGYNAGIRFRALTVLRSIVDENTLQDLTKLDLFSFLQYMKPLQYVNELDRLGLPYNTSSLECNRFELPEILLKSRSHSPRALNLIVQLYMHYNFPVNSYSFLDATLEQMAKQSMLKELEKCLPVISKPIRNCRGFEFAWQRVITDPFEKLDVRPTAKQITDCIGSLKLLPACPVATKLKFKDAIVRGFYCQQPYLVAALVPFLNDEDKAYVLQEIEKKFNLAEVIENLKSLRGKGILLISQPIAMIEQISRKEEKCK